MGIKAWTGGVAALVWVGCCVAAGAAWAADTTVAAEPTQGWCERSFDEAQRRDMEAFRDFDAEAFREVHHPDAVSIYPTGERFVGRDAIMEAATRHFTKRDAVWSWTDLSRHVEGCRFAVIEYDATYDIPRYDYHQRALTVVTYTFERGRWLAVMDQGTLLEISE